MEQPRSPLDSLGYEYRIVPIARLSELQQEMEDRLAQGFLDQGLYDAYLASFDSPSSLPLPEATSVILISVPQPQVRVTLSVSGEKVHAIIPPTYTEDTTERAVHELLRSILGPLGHRFAPARLPKKLLAARCGLTTYGRNNIAYASGCGSFHGMVTAYSDLPPRDYHWQQPEMLERCQSCKACLKCCPTQAIPSDRFLLRAERCLTFHNEMPGHVPFPDWIDPSWHNCLVGCMDCQRVCPENTDVLHWMDDGPEFSEEETALLLAATPTSSMDAATVDKLAAVSMDEYGDALARNLLALLPNLRA
jgi:epoxyqueuosine reductase